VGDGAWPRSGLGWPVHGTARVPMWTGRGWLRCHGSGRAAIGSAQSTSRVQGRLGARHIRRVGAPGDQVTTALGEAPVNCRCEVDRIGQGTVRQRCTGWGARCGAESAAGDEEEDT
jgi:hypothetical protein